MAITAINLSSSLVPPRHQKRRKGDLIAYVRCLLSSDTICEQRSGYLTTFYTLALNPSHGREPNRAIAGECPGARGRERLHGIRTAAKLLCCRSLALVCFLWSCLGPRLLSGLRRLTTILRIE